MRIFYYVLLFVGCFSAVTANAQMSRVERSLFGITANGGIAVLDGSPPKGLTSFPTPAFGLAATLVMPINNEWHLVQMGGFESRAIGFETENSEQPSQILRTYGLALQSYLGWKNILLGASVTIPVLSQQIMDPDPYYLTTDASPDPQGVMSSRTEFFKGRNVMVDVRLGTFIPLFADGDKTLHFFAVASYSLNNMISDGYLAVPPPPVSDFQTITESKIPTIQIGLSYLFFQGEKYEDNPLSR